MIKFFRKIRQKLLTENKFSKYLIYAIGEIILVVIGILIALSINNWNDIKKYNTKVCEQLKIMSKDLEYDINELNGSRQNLIFINDYLEKLLSTEYDSINLDLFQITMTNPNNIKFNNPYDVLYNSNALNTISDSLLLRELNQYYNIHRPSYTDQIEGHVTTVKQVIEEKVISELEFDTNGKLVNEKTLELLKSKKLNSIIVLQLQYFKGDLFMVNKTIKEVEKLKKRLENYLSKY